MDLYKLITLVIVLNLSLSMIAATTRGGTWDDWYSTAPGATTIISVAESMKETVGTSQTAEAENKLNPLGGISQAVLIIGILYATIYTIVLGGLSVSIALVFNASLYESPIYIMIGYFTLLIISTLTIMTGIKLYAWIINKDTT